LSLTKLKFHLAQHDMTRHKKSRVVSYRVGSSGIRA